MISPALLSRRGTRRPDIFGGRTPRLAGLDRVAAGTHSSSPTSVLLRRVYDVRAGVSTWAVSSMRGRLPSGSFQPSLARAQHSRVAAGDDTPSHHVDGTTMLHTSNVAAFDSSVALTDCVIGAQPPGLHRFNSVLGVVERLWRLPALPEPS